MWTGTLEDHQGPRVMTFGQLLVLAARQDGNAERHRREGVEQVAVLDQRGALVEQVLPLENALLVNPAVDADHQIERQLEVAAEFRQHPEDHPTGGSMRLCRTSNVVGTQEHLIEEVRRTLVPTISPQGKWREVRRQRDGAGLRTLARIMLEQLADSLAQAPLVAGLDARRLRQPLFHLRLIELEDQVVRAQAGDI